MSLDIHRITRMPRVDELARARVDACAMTINLRRHRNAPPLRPVQGAALRALADTPGPRGIAGLVGVGHGKTLIALLAPSVVPCSRPVVFVPPPLLPQARRDTATWGEHFEIHPNIKVLPYSKLSATSGASILNELRPDLLVLDEAHLLRHRSSARTKRVLRYCVHNPHVRVVVLSGTLTGKRLYEMSHLLELCLREGTPTPLHDQVLARWDAVVGVGGEATYEDRTSMASLLEWAETDNPRLAFQRRLRATPGVIATVDGAIGTSLLLRNGTTSRPQAITDALVQLEDAWVLPDGSEVVEASQMALARRCLGMGFYHQQVWPQTYRDQLRVQEQWTQARTGWHRILTHQLRYASREGMDSQALIQQAAERGEGNSNVLAAWERWAAVKDLTAPVSVPVWIDDTPLREAMAHAMKHPRAVVVYQSRAVEQRLVSMGYRVYGAGTDTPEDTEHHPCCSLAVHGKGKNMQAWDTMVVLEPPSSGAVWEQLIARIHRPGQEADLCTVDVINPGALLFKAQGDARYIEETTGQKQKLLFCSWAHFSCTPAE